MEIGIVFIISAVFFAWILKGDSPPKKTSPGGGMERTTIEFVRYVDYRTIQADIPSYSPKIVSANIKIQFMGFPNLDLENPAHKAISEVIANAISTKIDNAKSIEISETLRHPKMFGFVAKVYVDGEPITGCLEMIPNMEKYAAINTPPPHQIEDRGRHAAPERMIRS